MIASGHRGLRRLLVGGLLLAGFLASVGTAWALAQAGILAPAMRTMLAKAIEGATTTLGTTGVRAAVARTATLPGASFPVQVSRTMSFDKVLGYGLAAGAGVAGIVELADYGDCRFGTGGLECDLGKEMVTTTTKRYNYSTSAGFVSPYSFSSRQAVCADAEAQARAANPNFPGTFTCVLSGSDSGAQGGPAGVATTYSVYTSQSVYSTRYIGSQVSQGQGCEDGSAPRWDSKCDSGLFSKQSVEFVAARIKQRGWNGTVPVAAVPMAESIANKGVDIANADAPATISGPAQVTASPVTRTETLPDGTQVQTTTTTTYNITYQGDTLLYTTNNVSTTLTTKPDGTTTTKTETTTQAPPPTTVPDPIVNETIEVEVETCGLPGKPPCRIDETGTPTAEDPFEGKEPSAWFAPLLEEPEVADTSWTWSFQLPSHCSVINVGNFAGHEVSFDLCEYQGVIHDIMALLWLGAGVWFAIGMVGRTLAG